jgi:hypothetical protein
VPRLPAKRCELAKIEARNRSTHMVHIESLRLKWLPP